MDGVGRSAESEAGDKEDLRCMSGISISSSSASVVLCLQDLHKHFNEKRASSDVEGIYYNRGPRLDDRRLPLMSSQAFQSKL